MLVMKFGGASVASAKNFLQIADLILEKSKIHSDIVVVVSAMGKTTDQLLALAHEVHPNPPIRELDMLVSAGERVSISLLAMSLALRGKEAVSFTGSQSGIITCPNHTEAKIIDVRPARILASLAKGFVAIVAGFQGVSKAGEITTLGRGGSDTTAIALAASLGASTVEFYKDVDGIYSQDPKKDSSAKLLAKLSYTRALKLTKNGAEVLHPRSLELAEKNGIRINVLPFQNPKAKGTIVGSNEPKAMKMYE